MRKVRFVLVTDHEVADGNLPGLHGRQVIEASILPGAGAKKLGRIEFPGGVYRIMTKPRSIDLDDDDKSALEGEPWKEGRGSYFALEIGLVPIAVSDDVGINWTLLPQHPEYVPPPTAGDK